METIACLICGSKDSKTAFLAKDFRFKITDDNFRVVRCPQCGFIFLNPRPAENEIAAYYPAVFYETGRTLPYKAFGLIDRANREAIINDLTKCKKSGRLLDVGCGTGSFILEMSRRGYEVYGLEASKNAMHLIPRFLEGKVYNCSDLSECGFEDGYFDIITMFQSLEHVHNPNALLKEIRRFLSPEGIFYLSVPNADFCEYRIFRSYAYTLEVPRHLYFFTKNTLKKMLLKNGFMVKCFRRNIATELFITPASLYHGVWNYLGARHSLDKRIAKLISFIPLVISGFLLHILSINQGHILEALCVRDQD